MGIVGTVCASAVRLGLSVKYGDLLTWCRSLSYCSICLHHHLAYSTSKGTSDAPRPYKALGYPVLLSLHLMGITFDILRIIYEPALHMARIDHNLLGIPVSFWLQRKGNRLLFTTFTPSWNFVRVLTPPGPFCFSHERNRSSMAVLGLIAEPNWPVGGSCVHRRRMLYIHTHPQNVGKAELCGSQCRMVSYIPHSPNVETFSTAFTFEAARQLPWQDLSPMSGAEWVVPTLIGFFLSPAFSSPKAQSASPAHIGSNAHRPAPF